MKWNSNKTRGGVILLVMSVMVAVFGTVIASSAQADTWQPQVSMQGTYYCEDGASTIYWDMYTPGTEAELDGIVWEFTSVSITPAGTSLWWNWAPGSSMAASNERTALVTEDNASGSFTLSVTARYYKPSSPGWGSIMSSTSHTITVSPCQPDVVVTPVPFTLTAPTSGSCGRLSIPAQPLGVMVYVSGSAAPNGRVSPPWETTVPGYYSVDYYDMSGYDLANDPSGSAVVEQLSGSQCSVTTPTTTTPTVTVTPTPTEPPVTTTTMPTVTAPPTTTTVTTMPTTTPTEPTVTPTRQFAVTGKKVGCKAKFSLNTYGSILLPTEFTLNAQKGSKKRTKSVTLGPDLAKNVKWGNLRGYKAWVTVPSVTGAKKYGVIKVKGSC